jgi:uncharacterized protein (DUF2252 family)
MTIQEDATTPKKIDHLTVEERVAHGKAARGEIARSTLAEWSTLETRRDPIDILEEQARMLVSPFAFYRGAAALMAADLAASPRTGLRAQLCGDAHLSNFGAFAAPDRRLIFGVNDFDETLPGPFEWDVKRLVASFAVAGRELGFAQKVRDSVAATAARSYRESMHEFAGMRNMDLWYARIEVEEELQRVASQATAKERKRAERNVAKARTKDSLKAFAKLTQDVDGERRIVGDPPLIVPLSELTTMAPEQAHEELRSMIRSYRRTLSRDRRLLLERFRYVDAARKVVGVGSVGTRAWICLLLGRDDDDPLFLQAKEAEASVLEPYLGKSQFANHGQRVVEGQRLMQSASDIMLGWIHVTGLDGVERDFYVRQLWDAKGSAVIETMSPGVLTWYAKVCGWTLAKAHARSGDAVAIAAYLGRSAAFDKALTSFAEAYADQNERDYSALQEAVASGRIVAETGY